MKKVKKKKKKDSVKNTCTSSDHDEDTCKISEGLVKNCRRSCAHKVPIINSEPRTTHHRKPNTMSPRISLKWRGTKKNPIRYTISVDCTGHTVRSSYTLFTNNEQKAKTLTVRRRTGLVVSPLFALDFVNVAFQDRSYVNLVLLCLFSFIYLLFFSLFFFNIHILVINI